MGIMMSFVGDSESKLYNQRIRIGKKWINRTVYNVAIDSGNDSVFGSVSVGDEVIRVELRSVFRGTGMWFPVIIGSD